MTAPEIGGANVIEVTFTGVWLGRQGEQSTSTISGKLEVHCVSTVMTLTLMQRGLGVDPTSNCINCI